MKESLKKKLVRTEIRFYLRNWAEREPGYSHKCLKVSFKSFV